MRDHVHTIPMSATSKPVAKRQGQVRIIGGAWRRNNITFAESDGLRPTPDRVRETLFNWLGQQLHGLRVLDAFSGTGVLALEAASRGAAQVIALENNAKAAQTITEHGQRLGAQNFSVIRADALLWLNTWAKIASENANEKFDVIFLDPPFSADFYGKLSEIAPQVLAQQGRLYVEAPQEISHFGGLLREKYARAGQVHYHLFHHE